MHVILGPTNRRTAALAAAFLLAAPLHLASRPGWRDAALAAGSGRDGRPRHVRRATRDHLDIPVAGG